MKTTARPAPSKASLQSAIDCFWETVPPTWNRIRANIRGVATQNFGITVEQFHILRHIRKGLGSVSELAEVKQISRPAISQAVETLVSKGLVMRQHSPEDRRFVQLSLTTEGENLLNAIFEKNREWMLKQMANLKTEDLELLLPALSILKNIFEETEP